MTIDEAIKTAKREVKDLNAQAYLHGIPKSIELFGLEGFKTQILYTLSNMASWRGETARKVKTTMRTWIKSN